MQKLKTYHLILFCCCSIWASAQSPHFRNHLFEKSLGNIEPTIIYQDDIGKHWVGTQQGLYFFDGLTFSPFLTLDSLSNHVTAIGEINDQLWVGYEDGQIRFLEQGTLKSFNPEEGVPVVEITGILEDKSGVWWFSTYGEGVYYFYNNRLYNLNTDDGLLGDDIYTMTMDNLGQIWVGTDNGISICQALDGKKKIENLTVEDGLPDMIIKKIVADASGNIWIGTYENGIAKYDLKQQKFYNYTESWDYGVVSSLTVFEHKEIWIGTERQGLVRMNLQNEEFIPLNFYKGTKILDTHKDIEGNLWVISNKNGVQSANKQFEYIETGTEQIQALLTVSDKVRIGTQKGIVNFDTRSKALQTTAIKDNIITLYEDKYGVIWQGTFGNGIICYDAKTKKTKRIMNGLPNGSVLAIAGDENTIWLATLGGVVTYNLDENIVENKQPTFEIYRKKDGLGANYVYTIFIDSKGRVWFGTDGKGISVYEKEQFTNYSVVNNQPLKTVYSITEDGNGNIWFSTAKDGIYKFNGKEFEHFSYEQGLRDLEISSLVTDEKGNILILHPMGIDLLNPTTNHLIYYGTEVGIGAIDPNLNVFDTDEQGNIWLGTKKGIVKYFPLSETLEIDPHTILQGVSIYLKPVDFQLKNSFSHEQNYLTFEFIGLWYTDPKAVQYRYRLNGYDLDWNYTRDLRATYPNLPAGNYTFEIQSSENEGFEGVPTISYTFSIKPPFWQTAWFIALCIITLIGLGYWLIKYREQRLEKAAALKKEKIEFELQTLKSQVNPHFLFNSFNTLLAIVEEDVDLAAEYIEKLSDFYRTILQYQDQSVIQLQEELTLLGNYVYLLKKRHGNNLNINIQIEEQQKYDYLPPLTLQMLVENAVKHNTISKSKPLTITIKALANHKILIKNNLQLKKTLPVSTHFGLRSINKRYELLNDKTIEIRKKETTFEVIIPLLNNNDA